MPPQNRACLPMWRQPGNRRKFVPFAWFCAAFVFMVLSGRASCQQLVTIHLAGDSTMAEKLPEKRPETGWGERLQSFFDDKQVEVRNYAKNGRSTRTFISEGLWDNLLAHVKPGDYVFIQFGHNDESKEKADRYTPPDDYRKNLIRFIDDVRGTKTLCRLYLFPCGGTPVGAPTIILRAAIDETFHTNPKRNRGDGLMPSRALRVGVSSGRGQ